MGSKNIINRHTILDRIGKHMRDHPDLSSSRVQELGLMIILLAGAEDEFLQFNLRNFVEFLPSEGENQWTNI